MTVEKWLRGQFQGIGSLIEHEVLETVALSPAFARPVRLSVVSLSDDVENYLEEPEYYNGLIYALSTLYYAMSAAITGGTKSEKRGNRQITIGGYPLTTKDREAFRALGDKLRGQIGAELDEDVSNTGGLFDASDRIKRTSRYRLP